MVAIPANGLEAEVPENFRVRPWLAVDEMCIRDSPWPGMMLGVFQNETAFKDVYFPQPGRYLTGDGAYTIDGGSIEFDCQDITELSPDKRSRAGLFLSFQAPVEIPVSYTHLPARLSCAGCGA